MLQELNELINLIEAFKNEFLTTPDWINLLLCRAEKEIKDNVKTVLLKAYKIDNQEKNLLEIVFDGLENHKWRVLNENNRLILGKLSKNQDYFFEIEIK